MLKDVQVLCHSSIKFNKEKTIYFDPFKIEENYNDADIIFITHDHYDHFSENDIEKVRNENTKIVVPETMKSKAKRIGFKDEDIITVVPGENYMVLGIEFETIPAYNIEKAFHPKENEWVGYIINIDNVRYYIAGDTDITNEAQEVKCDVAFVPIGGTYTMNAIEAARLVNKIKPKFVVPIHYGSIVGTKQDEEDFKKNVDKDIKCETLIIAG